MSPRGVRGIRADTCQSCFAWGWDYNYGRCRPCWEFARLWPEDTCGSCLRTVPVKKGFCRLCWCQARVERSAALGGTAGTYTLLLPYVRQVRYQQLFLAGMPAPRDLYPKPEIRRRGVGRGNGRLPKPPPPPAAQPVVTWWQPPLFDGVVREYRYGQVDLRRDRLPDNPWLAWALHIAHTIAEARGFDSIVLSALNRALVMLLANHADGERIRFSDFQQVLRRRGTTPQHTAHVLSVMGILIDDRRQAIDVWLDNRMACLAPAIGHHTHRWARALLDGQPRSKPRNPVTVRNYIIGVQPILEQWSARYDHLREVTRDDVVAAITSV